MSARAGVRVWVARVVAAGALVAAAHGAVEAVRESRTYFRYARRHAGESLEAAQDRLFGAGYMASIRSVRSAIGLDQTVYFVDEREQDGSTYFALYHLAPRRLVRYGQTGEPIPRATKGRNRNSRPILVVPPAGAPLELVALRELAPDPKRARQARP